MMLAITLKRFRQNDHIIKNIENDIFEKCLCSLLTFLLKINCWILYGTVNKWKMWFIFVFIFTLWYPNSLLKNNIMPQLCVLSVYTNTIKIHPAILFMNKNKWPFLHYVLYFYNSNTNIIKNYSTLSFMYENQSIISQWNWFCKYILCSENFKLL